MTQGEALQKVIAAWEALPAGNYSPREVEQWLKEHMKPAVDIARALNGEERSGS